MARTGRSVIRFVPYARSPVVFVLVQRVIMEAALKPCPVQALASDHHALRNDPRSLSPTRWAL